MLLSGRQAAQVLHRGGISVRQARRVLGLGLSSLFPGGVFVARRDVPATAPPAQQLAAVQADWRLPVWVHAFLAVRLRVVGPMPFMATVAGFVVFGEPGDWFESVRTVRIALGPGGRPWWIAPLRGRADADPMGGWSP